MSNCDFVTFQCGILGQAWYLIVLIPDLWRLSYFDTEVIVETNVVVFLLKTIVSFNSGNIKTENLSNYYKTIKPISGSFLNAEMQSHNTFKENNPKRLPILTILMRFDSVYSKTAFHTDLQISLRFKVLQTNGTLLNRNLTRT